MEVRVHIERADVWQVTKYTNVRIPKNAIPLALIMLVLLWSIFSGVTSGLADRPPGFTIIVGLLTTAMIAGPICLVLYWGLKFFTLRKAAQTPGILGEHVYTVDSKGLHERTAINEGVTAWQGMTSLVATKHYLFFFVGPCLAHVIPRRAFRDEGEARAFLALSRSYWEAVKQ